MARSSSHLTSQVIKQPPQTVRIESAQVRGSTQNSMRFERKRYNSSKRSLNQRNSKLNLRRPSTGKTSVANKQVTEGEIMPIADFFYKEPTADENPVIKTENSLSKI
jgi:hypothetical protein